MARKTVTAPANAPRHQRGRYAAVAARYDNARNTPDTASLFRNVDSLASTAALSPGVRRTVRDRARYVVQNCPYAKSIIDIFVTHVVGPWATVTFPRDRVDEGLRDRVSEAFDAWAMQTDLWPKVKLMLRAKVTDGEAFGMLVTDRAVVRGGNSVSLNLRLIECDRVESYTEAVTRENEYDGIRFDSNGHPTEYRILKYHPGDYRSLRNAATRAGDWVRADSVIHFFEASRPEQVRGISDFVSALDIPALQKSYRSSVVDAAINAASVSGVLSTDQVPDSVDDDGVSIGKCAMDVAPNTTFQMQRGSLLTLPEGWHMNQLHSEQPTSLYESFTRSLIAELAACLSMPVNIAMCDSSQHNFASAKLDHMTYGDKIADARAAVSVSILDRVFFAWLDEYAARNPMDEETFAALHRTEWLFTERGNAEVMKDASADNTRLGNGTTTLDIICSKSGRDWKRVQDQWLEENARKLAKWREACRANGLPEDTPLPGANGQSATVPAPTEDEVEHEAEKSAARPANGGTRK